MIKIVGGFGSAGAGSRAIRHKATSAGVGSSYRVESLALLKRARQGHLGEEDKGAVLESINTQQCCFCDDARTFKAIGQHWVLAHGIRLNDLRDALMLPKSYATASKEVRTSQSKRSRKNWSPELGKKMHAGAKGRPRQLGAYARSIQHEKGLRAYASMLKNRPPGFMFAIHRTCPICGDDYYGAKQYKTCRKPACTSALRSIRSQRPAPWSKPPHKPPKMVPCSVCGMNLVQASRRKTCSTECRSKALAAAVNTPERQAKMRAGWQARVDRAPKACSREGCGGRPIARGLCEPHYRREPDQRAKQRAAYHRRRERAFEDG